MAFLRSTVTMLLVYALITISCGGGGPVIEVVNGGAVDGWPDGAVLMALQDGAIAGRAVFYGGHTRITLRGEGAYRIRAAGPGYLTVLSQPFTVSDGINRFELPPPSVRRRVDGMTVGLTLDNVSGGHLPAFFLEDTDLHVTTLTVPAAKTGDYAADIHHRLAECLVRVTITPAFSTAEIPATLDSLAVAGADGAVLVFDGATETSHRRSIIRSFASSAHDRGMTLAVEVHLGDPGRDNWYHVDTAVSERPDEIRFTIPASASADDIEAVTGAMIAGIAAGIPAERMTVVVSLTAKGIDTVTGGEIVPMPGVLDSLIAVTGGVMRLRDGSCRFGYGGVVYRFDDPESIAGEIRVCREAAGGRIGGMHIVWDGTGVTPDDAGFDTFIGALRN